MLDGSISNVDGLLDIDLTPGIQGDLIVALGFSLIKDALVVTKMSINVYRIKIQMFIYAIIFFAPHAHMAMKLMWSISSNMKKHTYICLLILYVPNSFNDNH